MNYYDILFARKMAGGQGDSYQLKSLPTGTISTIADGSNLPMPSLKVGIEPQQEGSGDPSPTNVRPISGWDEVVVTRYGKNLFKTNNELSWIPSLTKNADGTIRVVGSRTSNGAYAIGTVDLKANTTYTLRKSGSSDIYYQMLIGETAVTIANINDGTYTPTSDVTATIRIFARANITYDTVLYPQLEIGDTATTYEPYNGQTYTIQFKDGDNPLTVYGGTLDVVSGVLTVDKGYIASYNGETLPSTWISDRDVYVEGTSPTTGAQVVYELATPRTYQLNPTMVKSLLGTNNIWADTGDVLEGSYFKEL